MNFLFLDTETTGLERGSEVTRGDEVIQIGGVLTDENLIPLRVFDYLCDTTKISMSPQAQRVHGLSMQYIRSQVRDIYLEEVINQYLPELYTSKDLITVGHNIRFDIDMIWQTLRDCSKKPLFGSEVQPPLLPKQGRYYIDTVPYFMRKTPNGAFRQKLSTLSKKYTTEFEQFLDNTPSGIYSTNYERVGRPNLHNALVDSIYCYIIFKEQVWKTRLL